MLLSRYFYPLLDISIGKETQLIYSLVIGRHEYLMLWDCKDVYRVGSAIGRSIRDMGSPTRRTGSGILLAKPTVLSRPWLEIVGRFHPNSSLRPVHWRFRAILLLTFDQSPGWLFIID